MKGDDYGMKITIGIERCHPHDHDKHHDHHKHHKHRVPYMVIVVGPPTDKTPKGEKEDKI